MEYGYDHADRRISKKVSEDDNSTVTVTVDTLYCYSGGQVVAEYDYDDTVGVEDYVLARKFIYGPGNDEPICMVDVANSNALYYYHRACPEQSRGDGLGSVVALLNSSGTVVETYEYDAFGNTTICDGNGTPRANNISAYDNPYMYTGRRYDPETGLYYYRARIYSPAQ